MSSGSRALSGLLYRPSPDLVLKRQEGNWGAMVTRAMERLSFDTPLDQRFLIEMAAGMSAEEIAEAEDLEPQFVLQLATNCLNSLTNELRVLPCDLQAYLDNLDDAEETIRGWLGTASALRAADAPVQGNADERCLVQLARGYSAASVARWEKRTEDDVLAAAAACLQRMTKSPVSGAGVVAALQMMEDAEGQVRAWLSLGGIVIAD